MYGAAIFALIVATVDAKTAAPFVTVTGKSVPFPVQPTG